MTSWRADISRRFASHWTIVVSYPERKIVTVVSFLMFAMPALAVVYYFFSMLLMVVHDPAIPRMGPEFLESQKRVKVGDVLRSI